MSAAGRRHENIADARLIFVLLPAASGIASYRYKRLLIYILFTHVRLNIFPDGGISRLRLFGFPKL